MFDMYVINLKLLNYFIEFKCLKTALITAKEYKC